MQFSQGHVKKGDATDAFADSVSDCISKGVRYYINLPAGEGSPGNKRKGVGGGAAGS